VPTVDSHTHTQLVPQSCAGTLEETGSIPQLSQLPGNPLVDILDNYILLVDAVKLDSAVCKDIDQKLHAGKESVIKVGKRRFLKVK